MIAALDGEKVQRVDVHCGYLHRGFEKECEDHTWHNLIPYVDRLNYCSGADQRLRVLRGGREADGHRDHAALPLPAHAALRILAHRRPPDLHRRLADGAGRDDGVPLPGDDPRLHLRAPRRTSPARASPTPTAASAAWRATCPTAGSTRLDEILDQYEEFIGRIHGLMDRNRIFIDRTRNVGVISTADAINWGFTGPILRSTGAPRDLRKDTPYLAYAELDFEVPVGIKGDNYDRYYVRMREMDESVHMIRQLMDMLPDGPINVDDRRCTLPEKRLVYTRDRVADQPLQARSWKARRCRPARSTWRTRRRTASSASTW